MINLKSKEQFNSELENFCQRFPWITYKKNIDSSPGWLELVTLCFIDLEEILQKVGMDKLTFGGVYIRDGRDKSLGIYADFNPCIGNALIELCQDRIKDAIKVSSSFCRKCGEKLDESEEHRMFRGSAVCKEHFEFTGVFAEEFDEWHANKLKELHESASFETEEFELGSENNNEEEVTLEEAEVEDLPPAITTVSIRMYDMSELKPIIDSKAYDQGTRQRQEIAKKMQGMGEMRNFCLVPDMKEFVSSLKEYFPNFAEVIDFIGNYILLASVTGKLRFPPILLEGDPGIGKTAFAKAMAKILDTGYLEVHMENEQANAGLAGTAEYWGNSAPGILFNILVFGKTCNPLVVVDEVDKAAQKVGFNPLSPLYQLLERDTAKYFRDLGFRAVEIDASNVMWIMTANDSSHLDAPILSRMRRFNVPSPTREQAKVIARNIYTGVLERNEWCELFVNDLPDESIQKLTSYPPRLMKTEIEAALGKAKREGRENVLACDIETYKQSIKPGSEEIVHRMYVKILEQNNWKDMFDVELLEEAAKKLSEYPIHDIQKEIEAALGRAAKAERRIVKACDIGDPESMSKRAIGFMSSENKD